MLQVATSYLATLHAWRRYGTPNSPRSHELVSLVALSASGCRVVAAMKLRAREQGHDECGWQQQQHQLRLYFP